MLLSYYVEKINYIEERQMIMGRIIAVANQKGGVGKTTTSTNLSACLAELNKRVLLIDIDPQGNATSGVGVDKNQLDNTVYEMIIGECEMEDCLLENVIDNLDLLPSNVNLAGAEIDLIGVEAREFILKNCLKNIKAVGEYDYILIDAPPTLGGWVMNILCASDYVIMPVEASPWGLFGIANMFEFLEDVHRINENLELLGIAITKVDSRKSYYKQTCETLRLAENVHVFENIIRIDSEVEWSQDDSKPILVHKSKARSASEYMELAKEIDRTWQ